MLFARTSRSLACPNEIAEVSNLIESHKYTVADTNACSVTRRVAEQEQSGEEAGRRDEAYLAEPRNSVAPANDFIVLEKRNYRADVLVLTSLRLSASGNPKEYFFDGRD